MSANYKPLKQLCPVELGDISGQVTELDGTALDRSVASAERVLVNVFADGADELLSHWERVYGLTPDDGVSLETRVNALVAKIRAKGGLSRPYFIDLASSMNYLADDGEAYEIEIYEAEEFMVGWSGANDHLTHEDIIYIWQVNVLNDDYPAYYFHADDGCAGQRLFDFPKSNLNVVFEYLKPAETLVFFHYNF